MADVEIRHQRSGFGLRGRKGHGIFGMNAPSPEIAVFWARNDAGGVFPKTNSAGRIPLKTRSRSGKVRKRGMPYARFSKTIVSPAVVVVSQPVVIRPTLLHQRVFDVVQLVPPRVFVALSRDRVELRNLIVPPGFRKLRLNLFVERARRGCEREGLKVLLYRIRRIIAEFDGNIVCRDVRIPLQIHGFPQMTLETEAVVLHVDCGTAQYMRYTNA